jgi:endonuclease-3
MLSGEMRAAEPETRWIADKLRQRFGDVPLSRSDPVATLVQTILSQNTNDVNRDRAYAALLDRFGTLERVAAADPAEIAKAIRVGGLQREKSERIKAVLERILVECEALDLSFLGDLPLDQGLAWLLASPGVGKKTAGIVLLFSFGRPYFPADTHVKRVLTRFGLLEGQGDPHDRLNALLPKDAPFLRRLHLHLIRLGRETCHPREPECEDCPLEARCEKVGVLSPVAVGGTERR